MANKEAVSRHTDRFKAFSYATRQRAPDEPPDGPIFVEMRRRLSNMSKAERTPPKQGRPLMLCAEKNPNPGTPARCGMGRMEMDGWALIRVIGSSYAFARREGNMPISFAPAAAWLSGNWVVSEEEEEKKGTR